MPNNNIPFFVGSVTLQTAYFRFPVTLNRDPRFSGLTWLSKMTYVILLDKAQKAYRLGRLDPYGRPYIDDFSRRDIMAISGCSEKTAQRTLQSLYSEKGVGLISYVSRPGSGNIYYVHDITSQVDETGLHEYITADTLSRYQYWMIPQAFFTEDEYRNLPFESKLLYSALLARTALSSKNHLVDDLGRIYIYYTIHELKEEFSFGSDTVRNALSSLEETGLIQKERDPSHRHTRIYVKNFTSTLAQKKQREINDLLINDSIPQGGGSPQVQLNTKLSDRGVISGSEGGHDRFSLEFNYQGEGSPQVQRGVTTGSANKDITNNYNGGIIDSNNCFYPSIISGNSEKEIRAMDGKKQPTDKNNPSSIDPKKIVKDSLDYTDLLCAYPEHRIIIDALIEIIASIYSSERTYGLGVSNPEIRKQLLTLNRECFEYTLIRLVENKTKIKNVTAYYASALYNNAMTFRAAQKQDEIYEQAIIDGKHDEKSKIDISDWQKEIRLHPAKKNVYEETETLDDRVLRYEDEIEELTEKLNDPFLPDALREDYLTRIEIKKSLLEARREGKL